MDIFYKKFEDNFRGSRELIKKRLSFYLPLIKDLNIHFESLKVLDLGCGRGEWLELLKNEGINCHGVDLDEGMLSECETHGLNFTHGNIFDFLREQLDASVEIISSFHLIEHLKFEDLREMFQECFRVLKPGGLLILETPNCDNFVVGTSSFYLDPTHIQPLPSQLVTFMTMFYGFKKSAIFFLNSPIFNCNITRPSLRKVIYGVGFDYAVIAQKDGNEKFLKILDDFSEINPQKDLNYYIDDYDQRMFELDSRLLKLEKYLNFVLDSLFMRTLNNFYKKIKGK